MNWESIVLLSALLLLAYTWGGYPIVLWIASKLTSRPSNRGQQQPTFCIIITVYNEQAQIAAKLQDCLALQYPAELVDILVASDGSTDATEEIVSQWVARNRRIRLVRTEGRRGKSGMQNLAASRATGAILLFTDADTRTSPDLLVRIAADFKDAQVGMIAPVMQLRASDGTVSRSQGAYWRFEVWLRQMESDLGILATASGSAFAIRRELFRPIPAQFGDDCITPLDVRIQGFKILQDQEALVSDLMPGSVEGELRTRIRMTTRNWSGILSRPACLNPLRFWGTAWGLVSHKLLRWMTPVFLSAAFVANGALAIRPEWRLLFLLQVSFYAAAVVGWKRSRQQHCERIFGYPFAFCLANLGFLLGVVRALRGQAVIAYK